MVQEVFYEVDKPDFRQPDFEDLAMVLPQEMFKALMQRDDLTCFSEASVLSLVEKYISRQPLELQEQCKNDILPVVRIDKLPADRLIQMSKNPQGIFSGYQEEIKNALCRRLRVYDQQTSNRFAITNNRNYYGPDLVQTITAPEP
jgi:hypothetical protein